MFILLTIIALFLLVFHLKSPELSKLFFNMALFFTLSVLSLFVTGYGLLAVALAIRGIK